VSDRITRGRNAIFGHVARLPDNIPAHQAMLRQVELSVGRPQTLHGNVHQVDHVPNGPTNSAAITTMFPLRLCEGKLLVAVTRERRYGPSRLRVNDDDDEYSHSAATNRIEIAFSLVNRPSLVSGCCFSLALTDVASLLLALSLRSAAYVSAGLCCAINSTAFVRLVCGVLKCISGCR